MAQGKPSNTPEAAPAASAGRPQEGLRPQVATGPAPQRAPPQPGADAPSRRQSRRRPAGPARDRVAANDDVPSIGGLIFALHQQPSQRPFLVAGVASAIWALLGLLLAWAMLAAEAGQSSGLIDLLGRPIVLVVAATVLIPIVLFWFLALLMWRAHELKLMSSAMTEVAVRLAEPDRMAEQSIASLGQSVRRQVSFMNDAIGRAIGRASELEALVHSEVAALERSYSENEYRIRSLIDELASERAALANNSERVSETLHGLGAKVAQDIVQASRQATDALSDASRSLAQLIESRSGAIAAAATAAGAAVDEKLSERGHALLSSLSVMTQRIGNEVPVIIERMSQEQVRLTRIIEGATGNLNALEQALGQRTGQLAAVLTDKTQAFDQTFARHGLALDQTLSQHGEMLEGRLRAHTQSVDEAILRGTSALDQSISQRTLALATAMESHAKSLGEALARKSADLDAGLMRGIEAVRRSSENITRQSVKTIEGLASQAELLKDVSENLLGQIDSLTTRFEAQGKAIMKAAHALETSNLKIDTVLQARHSELSELLDRMGERARSFDVAVKDYSASIDGQLSAAERRGLDVVQGIQRATESRSREAAAELDRLRSVAESEAQRTVSELKSRMATLSDEISGHMSTLSSRFSDTSQEVRERALETAGELEAMQRRLRDQIESLPAASRSSIEAMRRSVEDQIKALEQLSSLASRQGRAREAAPSDRPSLGSLTQAYSARARAEDHAALERQAAATRQAVLQHPGQHMPALPAPPPQQAQAATQAQPPRARTGWSLGDLLDRASREEQQGGHDDEAAAARGRVRQMEASAAPAVPVQDATGMLNVGGIAQALDPVTAADVWTRMRSGQRGVLQRAIYSPEGQSTFDEITRRYAADGGFRGHVNRYLGDFERLLGDAEAKEPGGRIAESYLISETGRVYLVLAHASGRLA